jgi:hypothetical protein
MSEYITHIAVQEDTARLALHSQDICEAFKTCFRDHALAARLGSSSRGNSTFIVQNLHHFKNLWAGRRPEDRLGDKLAYTLGWITHRAADRYFKPRYGTFDKNPENLHPVEIRILHDVVVYEKVYQNGKMPPFSTGFAERDMKSHPAAKLLDASKAENLFGPMYQSDFLVLQSFDVSSSEELIKGINKKFPAFTVDFNRLIDAIDNPSDENRQQMIEAPNFYDENDEIIKMARNLQHGKSVDGMSLKNALGISGTSQYAETLIKSFNWIQEASDYFDGRSQRDKEALFGVFNIADSQKVERY